MEPVYSNFNCAGMRDLPVVNNITSVAGVTHIRPWCRFILLRQVYQQ